MRENRNRYIQQIEVQYQFVVQDIGINCSYCYRVVNLLSVALCSFETTPVQCVRGLG